VHNVIPYIGRVVTGSNVAGQRWTPVNFALVKYKLHTVFLSMKVVNTTHFKSTTLSLILLLCLWIIDIQIPVPPCSLYPSCIFPLS
jgi:hypothetical protein